MLFVHRSLTLGDTTHFFYGIFGLTRRRSGMEEYISGWRRPIVIPIGRWVVAAGFWHSSMTIRLLSGDDDG